MITSYILLLSISAWVAAFLLLQVGRRVATLLGVPAYRLAGMVLAVVVIGFLVVVAAPAPLLAGAVLVLVAPVLRRVGYLPAIANWAIPLLAALLAASSQALPDFAELPPMALKLLAALALLGMVLSSAKLPVASAPFSVGLLACSLPLLAAPFLGAPSFVALDVALVASALLGVVMVKDAGNVALARAPLALILGWMLLVALAHGAAMAAAVSALAYGAFLAYGLNHSRNQAAPYAP